MEEEKEKNIEEPKNLKSMLFGFWFNSKKGEVEKSNLPEQEEYDAPERTIDGEDENSQQEEQEKKDENIVPAKKNKMYELFCRQNGRKAPEENDEINLSMFMEGEIEAGYEERSWIKNLSREASYRITKAKSTEEEPVDALPQVMVTSDRMRAALFVFPPLFDGAEVDIELIEKELNAKTVSYGIDEEKLKEICALKKYFVFCTIAVGTAPVDGTDGEVIDHFRRDTEIQLTVKDDNTIDYKDLNWLQTINTDEVICDIVPPTMAESGMNVRGVEVKGKNGRKAVAPKGNGTKVTQDETQLLAALNGVLSFTSQRFRVDPLLIIKGDVDTSVGNLEVLGDVLINGDVKEGFTVKASGNITVQGMVEGANVTAGGDIQVGRGMNGNSHGIMEAERDVRCKYIENATVTSSGKIICDTIINSDISSDEAIVVKTGRGAIIGGDISAVGRIDALSIGNESNRTMVITLGATTHFLREMYELEEKRKEVATEVAELEKNISYLSGGRQNINEKAVKALDDMRLKLTVQKMQLANLDRRIAVMERKQADNTECRIRAEVIYPPAQINIGSFTKIVREVYYNALVYLKEGEIHIANV